MHIYSILVDIVATTALGVADIFLPFTCKYPIQTNFILVEPIQIYNYYPSSRFHVRQYSSRWNQEGSTSLADA